MIKCPNCQNEQQSGKFCGVCGTPLAEQQQTAATQQVEQAAQQTEQEQAATIETPAQPIQQTYEQAQQQQFTQQQAGQQQQGQQQSVNPLTEEQMEKLKSDSKNYMKFFMEKLTAPSSTPNFKFGLINIIAFLLMTALASFVSINNNSYVETSFLGTVLSVMIGLALLISVGMLAIFITTLFSSEKPTFKQIIEQYGNYSSITVGLSTIALLLFILKSFAMGFLIMSVALGITFVVQPTFIINRYIQTLQFNLDKYFMYLIFIIIQAVLFAIFFMIIADSFIGELFDEFNRMMYFF